MPARWYWTLLLLLLNAAYLYAFDSPTLFYLLQVGLHLGLGLYLLGSVLWYLLAGRRREGPVPGLLWGIWLAAGASGVLLLWTGTARPYLGLLSLHILLSLAACLATLAALVGGRRRLLAGVLVVSLVLPGAARWWRERFPDPNWTIVNPTLAPLSMEEEGAGPDSPFFPSAATTDVGHTIPSDFFMKPESCAGSGCHQDIYDQWRASAHRFSSFNNQWYRKSIEYMQEVVGTQPSKWCGGCHDHAVFFNGMMDEPIQGQLDRPEAHAGLTCTSCHAILAVKSTMGNGHFVIHYPPLHDLAASDNPLLKAAHDFFVKLDPGPHRQVFLKPFMRRQRAEFCSACHKVHLDVPVNQYRWIRGFNGYDPWQMSGVSGQGARSFYYPPSPKDCVDCHMPLVPSRDAGNVKGMVHSHRFPGANTALPVANRDAEQLRIVTEFLQANQVRVDIFALSEAEERAEEPSTAVPGSLQLASTFAEGDQMGFAVGRGAGYTQPRQVVAPIDRARPAVLRGETVRVDVVVRTLGVGHTFPAGTVDAFDVWVELKAEDEKGNILFWSGYVPEDERGRKGPVDPSAHFYRSLLLDEHGNPINKRNAWAARSVMYVRLIPPGAADTVHYRLHVPENAGERIFLTARVNYRKFAWWFNQWAYAGIRDPRDPNPPVAAGYDDGRWLFTGDTSRVSGKVKEVPELPIVVMAEAKAELRVTSSPQERAANRSVLHKEDLIRWNDYGIGLLLQGDLKAAEAIFQKVTEIDPQYPDGWVNMARVRVQEGRSEEALEVLRKALQIDPDLARAHFFTGLAYKRMGKYEQALEHFRRVQSQYPRDRVNLNEIGRILFLQRRFPEAVQVLEEVLRIDPEDLQAHYNLMLAFRGLGDNEKAAREQKLYLRYKADESAQAITGPYRLRHPEDNNERQLIHEHGTFPLDRIPNGVAP